MIILQANKFFHERGGSERYLFALSRALASRGHEVLHFAMAHPDNAPSPQGRYFVPQRDYASPAWRPASVRSVFEFIRSPQAARCLDRLLAERRPDVAHLHNIYHQLTPSIIERLAARRIPVVMTLHDYKLVCPSYTMFARGAPCYRCRG
ncbi:MAG TPA: glycosyltransferase, partial [Candidatus Krumholzibacteria bacterium]